MRRLVLVLLSALALACKSDRSASTASRPSASAPPAEPLPRPAAESLDPPAGVDAMGANLTASGKDVLATWLEPLVAAPSDRKAHRLRFARLVGDAWSTPTTIAEGPQLVANWADFPSVVAANDGTLVAHWAETAASGAEAYDVVLSRSVDGGATWTRLGTPHSDRTASEHGFVSLVAQADGVRAFWLDGRETVAPVAKGAKRKPMTLRTAIIGASPGADELVDASVCDCCGTSAAMTADGPVIAYRDRTPDEIRDIAIARQVAGQWLVSPPISGDGWRIPGCPVNGPAIDASESDLGVAWYTYAGDRGAVKVAFSHDTGATFSSPVEVDGPRGDRAPIGRVGFALMPEGGGVVVWMASDRERAEILLQRVTDRGLLGAPLVVAATSADRDAGFPRMLRVDRSLLVAWTDTTGAGSRIRVRRVPIDSLPSATPPGVANALAEAPSGSRIEPGQPAPDLAAMTADGPVTLAGLRGKPVVLNLWATWCEPCRHELPELAELHRQYAERGLTVVGLSTDREKSLEDVLTFASRRSLPFAIWHDRNDSASRQLGVGALPATFVIDASGTVIWRHDGAIAAADTDLVAAVTSALAPRPAPR